MSDIPPHIEAELAKLGLIKRKEPCKPKPEPVKYIEPWDGKGECPF